MKGRELLDQPSEYQLFKEDSSLWDELVSYIKLVTAG
jgi:hypothetical protein